jgi:N-acetylmuramoyl-L-alanine amidase
MTRTTDRDVTYQGSPDLMELQARADVANRGGTDLFVSVHCNASVSSAVRGSAIYWYKPQDLPLAECLDLLDGDLGFEQDGLIQNSFAVLRLTSMPAVLVETAFLTNPTEGRLLANPQIRQTIAERLALGLGRYMATRSKR